MSGSERVFATKLITKWLPTGHQVQKFGSSVTACHRCGEDETVDHLFQCKHNGDWSEKFLDRLDKFLSQIDTVGDIKQALMAGITRWIDEDLSSPKNRCPMKMREVSRLQMEIGWNLVFCGLLDENWGSYQDAAHRGDQMNKKPGKDGKTWSAKVSRWLINEARQIWLERNHKVNSTNDGGASKAEQDILETFKNLYDLRNEVSHHDRKIFKQPLDDKLHQPIDSLRVKNTIPTVNQYICDFKNKLAEKQPTLGSFS